MSGEYLPLGKVPARKVWLGGLVATPHFPLLDVWGGYPKGFHQPVPSATEAACSSKTSRDNISAATERAERRLAMSTAEGDDLLGLVVV